MISLWRPRFRYRFRGYGMESCIFFQSETEKFSGVSVCAIEPSGKTEVIDEIVLEYPDLKSQFFLSENQTLLWMDYSGTVHIRKVGEEEEIEIEGITGISNTFMNLADDGENMAYVTDHEAGVIRAVNLETMETEIFYTEGEAEFSLDDISSTDCTVRGFAAAGDGGGVYVWIDGAGQYIEIIQVARVFFHINMGVMMAMFLLIVLVFILYRIYYRIRHRQTVLMRIIMIFLVVIYLSDLAVERYMEMTFSDQMTQTQDLALSVLGEQLIGRIEENLVENGELSMEDTSVLEFSRQTGLLLSLEYEYTIVRQDEDGTYRIYASTQEYSNVPLAQRYTGNPYNTILEVYETGESQTLSDTDSGVKRRELFLPITGEDGTICGVLAIAVLGNNSNAQIWLYNQLLRIIITILMGIVLAVLVIVLTIFLWPLKRLKACADKMAGGELNVTVPVHGHDEIANISEAFNHMSDGISRHVTDIQEMSECYYKFIPAKILTLLGKESIRQVELGDEISKNMTILSMHAIDYPKQKLALSAETVYANINHILSVMVASIVEQQGMVEHFEDSGLTALFTEECRCAVDAAISIHRSLDKNAPGEGRCVAVTYGRVMLGVIGNETRLEVTAISNHADLAKALRTKGEKYGARILITHLIYQQIPEFERQYHARYLGNIYLSSTESMERIYDVYDGDPEESFYYKELTKSLFEEGVQLFVARKFYATRLVFVEVLKQHRKDSAAREYLYRCDRYYKLSDKEQQNVDTVMERF